MKVFRGAAVFFVFVILVVIVQCKKEEQAPPTETTTQAAPLAATKTSPCTGTNAPTPNCGTADPCMLTVSVNDTDDTVTVDRDPVYLYPEQHVEWVAAVSGGGKESKANIKKVHYLKQGENLGSKTGNPKKHDDPSCNQGNNKCSGAAGDVEPCVAHKYFVVVHHHIDSQHEKDKTSDPELEVAGTTTGILGTVVTTGTGSTTH